MVTNTPEFFIASIGDELDHVRQHIEGLQHVLQREKALQSNSAFLNWIQRELQSLYAQLVDLAEELRIFIPHWMALRESIWDGITDIAQLYKYIEQRFIFG